MALNNSINTPLNLKGAAIYRSVDAPPNPQMGDQWIETNSGGSFSYHWHWIGYQWVSQYYSWNWQFSSSAASKGLFLAQPQQSNWNMYLYVLNIRSLMGFLADSTNSWNFKISKVSETNVYTQIGSSSSNLSSPANKWFDSGIFTDNQIDFSSHKMIVIDATPGATVRSLSFASSLVYRLARG